MAVRYEWDVEVVRDDPNPDYQDIEDHLFQEDYAGCKQQMALKPQEGMFQRVVLVRDNDRDGSRGWAYIEDDGKLQEWFEDADGCRLAVVPRRFHQEVARS